MVAVPLAVCVALKLPQVAEGLQLQSTPSLLESFFTVAVTEVERLISSDETGAGFKEMVTAPVPPPPGLPPLPLPPPLPFPLEPEPTELPPQALRVAMAAMARIGGRKFLFIPRLTAHLQRSRRAAKRARRKIPQRSSQGH